jgi:hypothetical protein
VLAVNAALAVSVSAVVLSLQLIVATRPAPLSVGVTTQLAELLCVLGKLSVAKVPVVVLVPVVSVTVPLTPSHMWLLAHAIAGPVPAAAPAPRPMVPEPIMNLPATNPVAVELPLDVTVSTAAGLDPPLSTSNPPVPLPVEPLINTAFAPAPALISVWPF